MTSATIKHLVLCGRLRETAPWPGLRRFLNDPKRLWKVMALRMTKRPEDAVERSGDPWNLWHESREEKIIRQHTRKDGSPSRPHGPNKPLEPKYKPSKMLRQTRKRLAYSKRENLNRIARMFIPYFLRKALSQK